MDKIIVSMKNHAFFYVHCDYGIANELNDYFSFFAPGYKFMPAFKNKAWDGKIRIFDIRSNELPVGLLFLLKTFCKKREYLLEYENDDYYGLPETKIPVDPAEIMKFIEGLNLQSGGKPIKIRDYQFEAICESIHCNRKILLSPTSSGKSLIIYVLLRWFLEHSNRNEKGLIVVPTTSLVQQMYSDFEDYGWDVENHLHRIYSGKDKKTKLPAIISTWQSIYKMHGGFFRQFGAIFGDECHGFKAKSLSSIMNKSTEAYMRIGTTGTLDGATVHDLVLQGLFGQIYKVTTTKKLQDAGTVADLDIKILLLEYPEFTRKHFGKQDYQKEVSYIISHGPRNEFIKNLTLDLNGNTLVLFQFVEKHGKILYDSIKAGASEKRKVFFVAGSTDVDDREAIRKIVETQKNAIIVASMGVFSTGINIKNLHNIIFASFSKSQIRILQSIGRQLRMSDDGRTSVLYDIADDLHWKSRKNYSLRHLTERIKIYQKEQFRFTIYKVPIK